MNMKLVVLGSNMVLLSLFLSAYGLINNELELVGLAVSIGIAGGVILVYSTEPVEPALKALRDYISILINASTTVLEDLDLLNSKLCILNIGESSLIVYTKSHCTTDVNPGMGFTAGSPYYGIPVNILPDVVELREVNSDLLEDSMNTILVSELGLCKSVKIEKLGNVISVDLVGITKLMSDYIKYPVNPIVIITLLAMAKLIGRCSIHLVEKHEAPGMLRLVVKVDKSV